MKCRSLSWMVGIIIPQENKYFQRKCSSFQVVKCIVWWILCPHMCIVTRLLCSQFLEAYCGESLLRTNDKQHSLITVSLQCDRNTISVMQPLKPAKQPQNIQMKVSATYRGTQKVNLYIRQNLAPLRAQLSDGNLLNQCWYK